MDMYIRQEREREEVRQQRDHALATADVYVEHIQQLNVATAEVRMQNYQLRGRIDAIERHRWRSAMRAQVEAAENRASVAEEQLHQIRQQLEESAHGRRESEQEPS